MSNNRTHELVWWIVFLTPFSISAASLAGSVSAALLAPGATLPSDLLVALPVFSMTLVGIGIASILHMLALISARRFLICWAITSILACGLSFAVSYYFATAVLSL